MSDNKHNNDLIDLNEFIQMPEQSKEEKGHAFSEDLYRNNLDALSKYNPEQAEIIDSVDIDEEKIKVFSSESGNLRIVYQKEDGEDINIHSADDPVKCAKQAVDLLGRIEKEGIVVLFGFGLGYFAEETLKRIEKGHLLLIYEAVPEIVKLAFKLKDYSELFASDRVKIVLGENVNNYSFVHTYHQHIINGKFWVVEHKPSIKLNPKSYDDFFRKLNEEKKLVEMGISTFVNRGKEFIDAFFSNIPSIMRKPGVLGLKNIFKGCKAIVVSAGPSLDKNVHLLKKLKNKAVIITTGGALPTLLSADIIPDLVVEIDPTSENIEDKFQDIPVLKQVPFISLIQYTPELLKLYPGPLFMNSVLSNIAFMWMDNAWEDKGVIECFGGSVAHLAFAAAEFVGADTIAFIGQDLSYTGDRLHTVGYSDHMDRRMEQAAGKEQENIIGSIPVKDIFDEEVFTIPQFLTFRTSFETRIRTSGKIVVNATENGLPIEGTLNMRFADFIDEYCNGLDEIDTFSVLAELAKSKTEYNLDLIFEKLTFARKKYNEIKTVSRKMLKYIKKIKTLKENEQKDSPELNNILKKIQVLTEKAKHPLLDVLASYHYMLELYLKKHEILEIDEIEDKWEKFDKQLERGKMYYTELIKAINLFCKQLDKSINSLKTEKAVDSLINKNSINKKENLYKAGMLYGNAKMPAQAVKYLEETINNHDSEIGDQDSLIKIAEMYVKQYRFYDTREILTNIKVQEVSAKNEEKIAELLKTCNKKINEWESRKKNMAKLLKESEANYGSHLESGYFYFRVKDFERAEKAYLKAIEEWQGVKNQSEVSRSDPSRRPASGSQDKLAAAYYGLAHTYLSKDDLEKAVGALEKAIGTEPDNPVFYRDLGLISINNNDIASAEIFFTKAIELSPQTAELYKPLADLYMVVGDREKAVNIYEQALKADPDSPLIKQELAVLLGEKISEAGIC